MVKTNARSGSRSTLELEVEVSAEELGRAIDEAVRHLSRRTRVPGFRPGKVPRPMLERALGVRRDDPSAPDPVYDEAREHLYERTVIEALRDGEHDVLEIPAQPDWTAFEEGTGASYRVSLPLRPSVTLGDYADYPFGPQVEEVTDARIDAVVEQLREQHASLVPVEDRGAQEGDFAVIGYEGRRDGQPVDGAAAERLPLVIGRERMIPGFEAELVGMREGEERAFSLTFPEDYGEAGLAGQVVDFRVTLRELRERRLPGLDDDLAAMIGPYADLAALRADIAERLRKSSLDRARHAFADRVIEYATSNATVEVPDLLVDREVESMLDELKVRLAQQGIGYEDYLRVTEKDEAALRAEYRAPAEHRVKVLLVIGHIGEREGVVVPDEEVDAEIARTLEGERPGSRLVAYLQSERGRAYVRAQLRRSATVEMLVDRWIAAHPQFAQVQHTESAGTRAIHVGEEDGDHAGHDELALPSPAGALPGAEERP
jgi:trigger factor